MPNPLGIVAIFTIFGFLVFLIYQDDSGNIDVVENIGVDISNLQPIIKPIRCITDSKAFNCGEISYNFNNESVKEETKTIEITEEKVVVEVVNGTEVETIQNVTTTKVVPVVSEADIQFLDKQTGEFMVCHQGDQCNITALVKLYNLNEDYVDPPYLYQLTITCEFRDWCDTSRTKNTSAGTTTDGGGGVLYTWTTNGQDSLGEYEIRLSIRSAIPDLDGNPINLDQTIPLVLIS